MYKMNKIKPSTKAKTDFFLTYKQKLIAPSTKQKLIALFKPVFQR